MTVHPSHKTRFSDSSLYDEICVYCGHTDSREGRLHLPCPNAPMHPDEQAFLAALERNEDDHQLRLVYSDFLDEHGRHEEADRQRKWKASKEWMLGWVEEYAFRNTYDDAIEQGHNACKGEGMGWCSDDGADYFREAEPETIKEWFGHWSTITGHPMPDDMDGIIENRPFYCSC